MLPERSKLPVKNAILKRPRVDALLREGISHPLFIVTAGPGYGKTVTVSSFVKPLKKRLAWLLLKRADNNIQRFWSSFVFALREELPEVAQHLNDIGFPDSPGKFDVFLRIFTRALYNGEQVILVVDDFFLIKDPEVRQFFANLTDMELENFCLILISESYSDISTLFFPKGNMAMVLTMADLKFTVDETAEYFARCGGILPEKDVHRIVDTCDGWPLALYYICLQLQAGEGSTPDVEGFQQNMASVLFENRFYIVYPTPIRKLLVQLSVLSTFPLEMVKRLYTGNVGEACNLLTSNMFMSYDYKAGNYTFQSMYQNFLISKQSLLEKDEMRQAYKAAGDWMFSHDQYLEAATCFRNCKQYSKMLKAIDKLSYQYLGQDVSKYILSCLDTYDREFRAGEPLVAFHRGTLYKYMGEAGRARQVLLPLRDQLVGDSTLHEEYRALLGELYYVLADFSMVDTPEEFVDNIRKAAELLPGGSHYRKREVMYLPFSDIIFLPENSAGQLEKMVDVFFKITEYESLSGGSGYGFEWLFAAEAAYKSYHLDRAAENCFLAIHKAMEMGQHDIVCSAGTILIHIAMFSGAYNEVANRVAQLEEYIANRSLVSLYELRDVTLGWLYIKLGDLDRVPRWITDEDSETYTRQPGIIGRGKLIYAYYLMAKHEYYKASAVLLQTQRKYALPDQWALRLSIHIAKTECFYKNGDRERALDALWEAYEMTHENNIIVPFIEVGNTMRSLVEYARKSSRYAFDVEWLDSVFQKASTYAKRLSAVIGDHNRVNKIKHEIPVNPLTPRETEVLRCLLQGLTREEMADYLSISISGVKKHITNIYNKLGAVNKVDAIHIALTKGYV